MCGVDILNSESERGKSESAREEECLKQKTVQSEIDFCMEQPFPF